MKRKIVLIGLIILLAGSVACVPVMRTVASTESQTEIADLTGQLSQLQSEYDALQSKYQSDLDGMQGQVDDLNEELAALQVDYNTLQQSYNTLINGTGQSGLRNPTWAELYTLLIQDDTDTITYDSQSYDCSGYAITIRDHVNRLGIRAAYVEIELPGSAGHALNAFDTTDKGLVYIDDTEGDKVGYVKAGQPYGTIGIDAVKTKYIACDTSPEDFWKPLSYETSANPFGYDYYLDYQARRNFYSDTIKAFNEAVNQYNSHTGQWTSAQLDTWRSNIEALAEDLGAVFYQPLGAVGNIEIYWGDG